MNDRPNLRRWSLGAEMKLLFFKVVLHLMEFEYAIGKEHRNPVAMRQLRQDITNMQGYVNLLEMNHV